MKRLLPVLALFAVLCGCCSCGRVIPTDGEVAVVPLPEHIVEGQGTFRLTSDAEVVLLFDDERLSGVTAALNKVLMPLFGRGPRVRHADKAADHAVNVTRDETMPAEAYRLFVTPCRIDIVAGGAQGVFYAVQTLRQLLPAAAYEADDMRAVELPVVTIEDKPCLGYRGMMLDVGRHFFTVDEVKEALDIMALHKLNVFHWHLTDDQGWRIEIRKYPKLTEIGSVRSRTLIGRDPGGTYDENCKFDETPYGGYYTQDEIRDVVNYAAERFITVIPEIEFPGHAVGALASYPWLGCTGEQYEVRQTWDIDDRVFCIGKETTFEFIEGVLEEVLELFPSEYIHIGGDECPTVMWKKCPHCKARMKAERLKRSRRLQNYATARVEKFLNAHGRRLIGWDEILEGEVTPTATIMSWRGAEGGIKAAKMGNHAIMAPTTHCYLDYYQTRDTAGEPLAIGGYLPVEKVYSLDPFEMLTADEQRCILGVQANLWTEYIATWPHAEYMLLPRLSALAEVGWSLDRKDYGDYLRRVRRLAKIYDACGYNYAKHIFGK
ncbi:beta-N-acetylhexosaminidase [Alistipes finegoldii]|uniref:beta-N-acetylhexosaminidase n=1 Tax=Alistipes finegoldii TaxID=214856 RepID=UPI001D0998F2|nr:beta-N-acetylhexosaminidase [Alistipes finegoldii]MCB6682716.1 beta-N-acetylhexosaminidase [Alistipes finegoldii]